jgi:DNA-binding NtrC family response regulator
MPRSILVVDDDAEVLESLADALAGAGLSVQVADSGESALGCLNDVPADVVLTDVRMPGMGGLELLRRLRKSRPEMDVIVMTAFDDLPTVSNAMREGAADFLVKPLDLRQLRAVIDRVFEDRAATDRPATPDRESHRPASPVFVGHHPSMVAIFKTIGQVAGSRVNVIIRGESGTGKELVARAIHDASPHASQPFVPVNCTALPATLLESELFGHVRGAFTGAEGNRRGRFALAGTGTIFLDEIGDTTQDFQAKLLRVLQEHEYYPVGAERPERADARVIAATHRDLEAMVEAGQFREDLYYRLRVVEITVPPLRERPSDIPALAEHLLRQAATRLNRPPPALDPASLDALAAHAWPGNVRELENCLMRAAVMATGGVLRPEHLALDPRRADTGRRLATLDDIEREHVAFVLDAVGGNRTRAAEVLGVSRPRLRRLMARHGLEQAADEDAPDATPESSDEES